MKNENGAPDRIWVSIRGVPKFYSSPCKDMPLLEPYTRADLSDAKDKRIAKLTEALGAIKIWGTGPSGSTTAERSMRRIAEQALAQTKGETD